MAKDFGLLQHHPSDMPSEALRAAFRDQCDSDIMRSIIAAEVRAIRGGLEREERTLRYFWYTVVKPTLSRAGILNAQTSHGNPVPWDRKLSDYLVEMVVDGLTTYEELSIVDGSRQRQTAVAITRPVADVQLTGAHFPWVVLFTEKDSVWPAVQAVAQLYGVSAISGGGEPSNACSENTVRAIVRSEAFQKAQPEDLVLLMLTDYDPTGRDIANAQAAQALAVLGGMQRAERGACRHVTSKRLGIRPDQLTPEDRMANAYEPKRKGLAKWFAETGGVDGQPLGLELDALSLSTVRQMFAVEVERYIDLEKRKEDVREAFLDVLAYDLLGPDLERRRQAMREAAKQSGAWQAMLRTPFPDDLFSRAATEGMNHISPTGDGVDLFDAYRQELEQIMAAHK